MHCQKSVMVYIKRNLFIPIHIRCKKLHIFRPIIYLNVITLIFYMVNRHEIYFAKVAQI